MAISRSPVVSNLGAFVVIDTDVDETPALDTTLSTGSLHTLSIDNSANGAITYFKMYDTATVTVGTTVPDLVIMVAASSIKTCVFPEGLVFGTAFSHCAVTAGGTAGTTGPTSAVTVRYVTT